MLYITARTVLVPGAVGAAFDEVSSLGRLFEAVRGIEIGDSPLGCGLSLSLVHPVGMTVRVATKKAQQYRAFAVPGSKVTHVLNELKDDASPWTSSGDAVKASELLFKLDRIPEAHAAFERAAAMAKNARDKKLLLEARPRVDFEDTRSTSKVKGPIGGPVTQRTST